MRSGTLPSSTMSKSVWHGGAVGNHTRIFCVTRLRCELANENSTLEGRNSHVKPYFGATFMNEVTAAREPIGLVQPMSRMTKDGCFHISIVSQLPLQTGSLKRACPSGISTTSSTMNDWDHQSAPAQLESAAEAGVCTHTH